MASKKNMELKSYATERGVKLWKVAEKFGVTDITMSRWLRKDFEQEKADKFRKYVDEIANG